MKYKEKIQHAKVVAEQLVNDKSLEQVKLELKEKGLYEFDINNVIASARNIIGEKHKPQIRAKLLAGEAIKDAPEFQKLDAITLEKLVKQEINSIAADEKKKVYQMLKDETTPEEILRAIRLDFYPQENVLQQIANYQEIKRQNSGSVRMLNIVGGIGLMVLGAGISYATMQGDGRGRLFYGLIIVGFIMMVKGFITAPVPRH